MSTSLEAKLLAVAGAFLNVDSSSLTLDSGPGDVARWDSFAHVGLIAEIESQFDLTFDVEEMTMFETLRDIHDAIRTRIGSGLETAQD